MAETDKIPVLRVNSTTSPNKLAGALVGVIREKGSAEIHSIGAGALNQAVKALAIARGFAAPQGMDLIMRPSFHDVEINGETRTSIVMNIVPK